MRIEGLPGHEEMAMGAIATGDVHDLNPLVINSLNIPQAAIDRVTETQQRELERPHRYLSR